MNKIFLEVLSKSERLKDYHNVGPVQRAAVEQFYLDLLNEFAYQGSKLMETVRDRHGDSIPLIEQTTWAHKLIKNFKNENSNRK